MKLNPHGDAAIYDTLVRLSRGYGALLHPLVDSKGNFGKVYSRDMAWAASRYTEVRLDPICAELFRDIDQDTVDFVDNYDGKLKEPTLLPTTFPNVLVSANQGIAVGMASNLCGFNLGEVCDTTIAYLKDPDHDLMATLKAPDLPTGGELLYDASELASRSTAPAGAPSRCGPSGATSRRTTSSRSTRSPTPPPWRPSWTRWPSSSRRARSVRSPTCGTRPT